MKLSIRKATKTQRKALRSFVPWAIEHICGPRLSDKLDITIEVRKFRKDEGHYKGFCEWTDDENHRPRKFVITLEKLKSLTDLLTTCGHELVHVKQYAKGEMKESMRHATLVRWCGQMIDPEETDYWNHPWEIEAFGKQLGLVCKWAWEHKDTFPVPQELV